MQYKNIFYMKINVINRWQVFKKKYFSLNPFVSSLTLFSPYLHIYSPYLIKSKILFQKIISILNWNIFISIKKGRKLLCSLKKILFISKENSFETQTKQVLCYVYDNIFLYLYSFLELCSQDPPLFPGRTVACHIFSASWRFALIMEAQIFIDLWCQKLK